MTAKKVRCNRWKTCKQKECPEYKEHDFCDPICLAAYCRLVDESAWCIPVKPRKPSPTKPEKIWVVQEQKLNSKKWGVAMYRFSYSSAKKTLKEWRHHVPSRKFRLREYTAGKVLKD